MAIKKLIEVALPLEAINEASAREKSIRHGHPSTLHLWWARRPLATARAVIWSSLVDDPSSHPELFPTDEAQNIERKRLFGILERLVKWENSNNKSVLQEAKAEIIKYVGDNVPELLDPFAGGGAIPLEAQRLGLKAHAHDLNPVAVMINKAMIELPSRFSGKAPVNPDRGLLRDGFSGAAGLAEDINYYGEWMKQEAFRRIGHLYPKVKVPKEQGGGEATVIAWIWARTVKCPNPACKCEMPLARSFVICQKRGKKVHVNPEFDYTNKSIAYTVKDSGEIPEPPKAARGANFRCILCGGTVSPGYIKTEGLEHRIGSHLMAVAAEGRNGRIYLSADSEQVKAAKIEKPEEILVGEIGGDRRALWAPLYGYTTFESLFTPRQLTALTTFSDLVAEAQKKAEADAVQAGMADDGVALKDGGAGARAYGEAVGVYLAFVVDKMADYNSAICSWHVSMQAIRNTFGRQAIPMVWDYAEANPFSNYSGCFSNMLEWVYKCVDNFPTGASGLAVQFDAQSDCGLRNSMVSTDPPYYDNIGYADLSDFFYVWLRRSLRNTYPELFSTMLVPKAEELIATPYRHEGSSQAAKEFFEDGMLKTCRQIYRYTRDDIPVTIYYAYKQSDTDASGTASSGWETMLSSIIKSGFAITGTWPMRTEMSNRSVSMGTNALASSIVLVCRRRAKDAKIVTRRNFVNELRRELKPALEKLQQSNIHPVDLAQSALGPGMAIFSKYKSVLEADGKPMSVRSALMLINQELDLFFNNQDVELDASSRFCVELYTQRAFNDIKYGDADNLARAKNTSVDRMAFYGVLHAKKGIVRLLSRDEIAGEDRINENIIWLLTQQLTRAMEKGGVEACARIVAQMVGFNTERAKSLAYRLYTIADKKGWAQEAFAYNSLVAAWPEIQARAAELAATAQKPEQMSIFN